VGTPEKFSGEPQGSLKDASAEPLGWVIGIGHPRDTQGQNGPVARTVQPMDDGPEAPI
jgi:hypothetical protein